MPLLADDRAEHLEKVKAYLNTYLLPHEIDKAEGLIHEILDLKEEKNAVILGHNYMTPDVFYGVSDCVGDSLGLSRHAAKTDASIILFNGVHFMAETAKILNPEKKVLIADLKAGCSLAEAITAEEVRELKQKYPGRPVVTYINCTAAVKAECDVVCTSANAVKVVNSLDSDEVIMIPDGYLAGNVQKETQKKIYAWAGKCMVHELFSATDVKIARKQFKDVTVISHPECKPEVTEEADFSGSTSEMADFLGKAKTNKVVLLTECSMGSNLAKDFPQIEFVSTCQTCPHMKKITLKKVRDTLKFEQFEIDVDEDVRVRAKVALDRMLEIK